MKALVRLIAVFCACGLIGSAADKTGSVVGNIQETDTNVPIEGASVAISISGKEKREFSTTSDKQGYYSFEQLPIGRGSISVSRAGYGSITPFTNSEQSTLEIRNNTRATKNFSLNRASTLIMHLVDSDTGLPVTGISAKPMRADFGVGVKRFIPVFDATIGETRPGVVVVSGLLEGEYVVEFEDPHDRSAALPNSPLEKPLSPGYGRTYYPNSPSIEGASMVYLSAGSTQNIDVALRKRVSLQVSGFVKIVDGPDAPILMYLEKEGPGMFEAAARLQLVGGGAFQMNGISEGHYRLMAWSDGHAPSDLTYDELEVDIGNKDIREIRLNLQKGSLLRGRLIYPDKFVTAQNPSITISPTYRVGVGPPLAAPFSQDGLVRFENVVRGTYSYTISGLPDGLVIKKVTYKDQDVTNSTVMLDASSTWTELEIFTTQTFCLVSGYVKSKDDLPYGNATVVIIPDPLPAELDPWRVESSTTDATGFFSIRMALGDYRAVVVSDSDAKSLRDVQMIRRAFSSGVKFSATSLASQIRIER